MKKEKRLCFLCYSLAGGGAERNVINLTRYLEEKGWSVDIVMFFRKNDYWREYGDSLRGINIISIFDEGKKNFTIQPRQLFRLISSLNTIVKSKNYDLLVGSVEVLPFYVVVLMGWIHKKNTVVIVGNNLLRAIKENYRFPFSIIHLWMMKKIIFKNVTKIICVSWGLKKQLATVFKVPQKKIEVIYNGLDHHHIEKRGKMSIPNTVVRWIGKSKIIVYFGRIVQKKGLILLINAFREVNAQLPTVKLLLVGQGCYKKRIEALIKHHNLTKHIFMTGFINNPYSYLKKADIFVFPSLYEGFGNTIVEAMTCQLAIVATDCEFGPREILSDINITAKYGINQLEYKKYGILSPMNEKYFARACINLLLDSHLLRKYKERSVERSKFFSLEKMGACHLKLFDSLLNQK